MRLLHLGDLHFGKRLNNLSLTEDQKYVNNIILKTIDDKKIDAVMIAGDVYDKSVPSEEAVSMLNDFLVEIAKRKIPVMLIAGNHDSAERLSFGDKLIEAADIYISPCYEGNVKKVTLKDEYGPVNFYLMPFVKPIDVKHAFPEEEVENYTDAMSVAIKYMDIDLSERNIILSHQFVTGASRDGSEDELYVGGLCNVDSRVYEAFDYTALGHIHKPQKVADNIRYCGSPIKFSFNEERQNKQLTIVDIKEKGHIEYEEIPITLFRDFITLKGYYEDIKKGSENVREQDFVRVILTDEDDIPNAFSNLTMVYPYIMYLGYENKRSLNNENVDGGEINTELTPMELISEFYRERNGQEMNAEQTEYLTQLISEIWR